MLWGRVKVAVGGLTLVALFLYFNQLSFSDTGSRDVVMLSK